MKPFDLVEVKSELRDTFHPRHAAAERFVFLGEILQVPGRGVFAVVGDLGGTVYSGLRMSEFRVVRQEDVHR